MDLTKNAMQLLVNTLKNVKGVSVTYRRANDTIDGLTAIPAQVRNRDFSLDPNVSITGREQDFLIDVTDLAISGQPILPKPKDLIEWVDGDRTYKFIVTKRFGDRCFKYSDASRQIYRVFCEEN